jgi:CheY-like chemotaxis protein
MTTLLARAGCRVVETFNGARALELLDQNPEISVLIADVRMSGMSGIKLAGEAQKRRPDLRSSIQLFQVFRPTVDQKPRAQDIEPRFLRLRAAMDALVLARNH